MKTKRVTRFAPTLLLLLLALVTLPPAAAAATISLFAAPDTAYRNALQNPCIFYSHDCNNDPDPWYPVAATTSGGSGTLIDLSNTFSPLTYWNGAQLGSLFVLGWDANESSEPQTLNSFNIYFDDVLAYSLLAPISISPSPNNGTGWADFVLAAGCAVSTGSFDTYSTCDSYAPFVLPDGTTSIRFDLQFFSTDGADQVFVLTAQCPDQNDAACTPIFPEGDPSAVPEPGTLLLLGSGALVAFRRRFRRQ